MTDEKAESSFANRVAGELVSRSSLQETIRLFKLYPAEVAKVPLDLEDVVAKMRDRIAIRPVYPVRSSHSIETAFVEIAFTYHDPVLAQRVSRQLAGRLSWLSLQETHPGLKRGCFLSFYSGGAAYAIGPKLAPVFMAGFSVGLLTGISVLLLRRFKNPA